MTHAATVAAQLESCLKQLCLPTARACYAELVQRATQESLSYEQFLLELREREREGRWDRRIQRLLRESRLPLEKSLESFDMKRLPAKLRQQVASLLDGSFLDRRENILAFGKPASGKTHLLCALCQELVRQGRRVRYTTCSLLVQQLLVAKRDLVLPQLIKRLGRCEALLIDDLGYVRQDRDEIEVLFTLLAQRYERGSVLITSNLPFSAWEHIFKDPMTTAAAIDRLVHHSVILELNLGGFEESSQLPRPARQSSHSTGQGDGTKRGNDLPIGKRTKPNATTTDSTPSAKREK